MVMFALAGIGLLWLFAWFVRLERRNQRHTIFVIFVTGYLAEAILASQSASVAVGILRPKIAGQDFRLPDVLIVLVLAARCFGTARGGRIMSGVMSICAFGAWYATAAVVGLLNQMPTAVVLFQGKAIFYVLGAVIVGSGVDTARLSEHLALPAVVLASVLAVAAILGLLHRSISVVTPVQRFDHLGMVSNDTASVLVVIGALVLVAEAVRPRRRRALVVAGIWLLMAPLVGDHRATYLVLMVVVGMMLLAVFGRTWSRRSSVRPSVLMCSVLGVVVFGMAAASLTPLSTVVLQRFDTAFAGEATARSSESRVVMAERAVEHISEHPIIGSGVGMQVLRTGEYMDEDLASAHNFLLDITLRSGLVGLTLFLVVLFHALRIGVQRWRTEPDHRTAVVCLAATLGVAGVLSKAMVEPALDKYRLSILFGLCVGVIFCADRRPTQVPVPGLPTRGPRAIGPMTPSMADVITPAR